jgi:TolA-binding protein
VKVRVVVQFQVNCTVKSENSVVRVYLENSRAMAELRKQLEEMQQALPQLQNQRPPQAAQQRETQTVINSGPAPEKFTFIKDDWKSWITHFERYRKAQNKTQKPNKVKSTPCFCTWARG